MIACEVRESSDTGWCPALLACRTRSKIWLATLIAIQLTLFVVMTLLSFEFEFDSVGLNRPLVTFYAILAAAFVAYLASIPIALRLADSTSCVVVLFLIAIAMRSVVLVSEPIQEVDIYRYVWDGAVSGEGINPYRFRPLQVRQAMTEANDGSAATNDELRRLAMLAGRPGLRDVLNRVHYGELPTVYPPVSQLVFQFSNWMTPTDASVTARLGVMKAVIVLFDIGVMGCLLLLLKQLQINPGWCIAYGWSPLVIKEFANSGHLDSIALFLCLASLVCITAAFQSNRGLPTATGIVAAAVLLGLGVGAKLYPVVLFPLVACLVWKRSGLRWAMTWAALACLVSAVSLAPMALRHSDNSTPIAQADGSQPLQGLTTFLTRWEMNDLLFMIVEENIRPEGSVDGQPHLWFAITPDRLRVQITDAASSLFAGDAERTPFLLTRLLTTCMFAAIVLLLCRTTWHQHETFYEAAFLTLAWFWFLSPTQNPWYWIWALPLVPMARNRLWLLVSGLTLIYYGRFWFEYNAVLTADWGLAYQGVAIFDFVIVWIEFAPFLVLLAITACRVLPLSNRNTGTLRPH